MKTIYFIQLIALLPVTQIFSNAISVDSLILMGVPGNIIIECNDAIPAIPSVSVGKFTNHTTELADTLALPDGVGVDYSSTLLFDEFADGEEIIEIEDYIKVCLKMEHSFLADISIALINPNGEVVILESSHNGWGAGGVFLGEPIDNSPDNSELGIGYEYCFSPTSEIGTWFSYINDGGATPNNTLPAGTYGTEEPLTPFLGTTLNGAWTISILDDWGIDDGWIFEWNLEINTFSTVDDVDILFVETTELVDCGSDITRTWSAYDYQGNLITKTQIISIRDFTPPELMGVPEDVTVDCDNIPDIPEVTVFDNCHLDNEQIELSESIDDLCGDCLYIINRCWMVTDTCGNYTESCQVITVKDLTPPLITNVPGDIEIFCGDDLPTTPTDIVGVDNCDDDVTISFEEIPLGGDCDPVVRIWTATDNAGWSTSDTMTIFFAPMMSVFSPGASWTYGYSEYNQEESWLGYEEWNYVGEVIFDDVVLKKVERTGFYQLEEGVVTEEALEDYYYRVDGNKVFGDEDIHKVLNDYTTLLYDFDVAVGDFVQVNDDIKMLITQKELRDLDGTTVLEFTGETYCFNGIEWLGQNDALLFNTLMGGHTNLNMFRHACIVDGSHKFYTLRCYEDNEMSYQFVSSLCGYVEGVVDVYDLLAEANISIFPNPIEDYINIKANKDLTIKIYNSIGKFILTQSVKPGQETINVDNLPNGLYYIEMWDEKGKAVKKLIK